VLVNNAGNFIAGFFEEISPEQFRAQTETTLFGPMNITRAVLPVMRAQPLRAHRAGVLHRLRRVPVRPRGLDGVAGPWEGTVGIRTMLVEPGFFRTELLTPASTSYADRSIGDFAERTGQTITAWNGMNGRQGTPPSPPRPSSASPVRTDRRCAG
jgi:hypothetical protein